MKLEPRRLTEGERLVLDRILAAEFQGVPALREQALGVRVVGRCDCGCPSVELEPAAGSTRSDRSGRLAPVELAVAPLADELPGAILLFVDCGRLAYLEYVYYCEPPPSGWPSADRLSVVENVPPPPGGREIGCGSMPDPIECQGPDFRQRQDLMTQHSPTGIAYDRAGPTGRTPIVLVHAGVADRRMWDPQWSALTADRDALRLDLRGFGESVARPAGPLSPVDDLLGVLDEAGIGRCHLVGASFGAGVVVEAALTRPELAQSLLLSAPGGSLIAEATPQLREFFAAERTALAAGDLDAATEANLRWWVDGPHRAPGAAAAVRDQVAAMQRLAFELIADWDDVTDAELDPPALDRLGELTVPTLVLAGALDIDAIGATAARVAAGLPQARLLEWPDVAHLPSMERPDDFTALLRRWLAETEAPG